MKFIIDAQLPFKLAIFIAEQGFDVIHTDNLPDKERTKDTFIRDLAVNQGRVLITKDYDFLDSFYLINSPDKLLLITTGNIRNTELMRLFQSNFPMILDLFKEYSFVELNNNEIIGHE